MPLFIIIIKALCEILLCCILAQYIVALFSPSRKDSNPIYQLFDILTKPAHTVVRKFTPSIVLTPHIPLITLFLTSLIWTACVIAKIQLVSP